ncbi:glycosyltransferase family 4 protein [Parvularcula marina]|uniref:glycosyltransferase family 4 protein n=2 Tax=Parvularcula marina TaxID=2292771 RepID=UPI003514DB43
MCAQDLKGLISQPMRIIAANRFYRPDHSATSQILTDLAEALVRDGHEVTVITSRLGYEDAAADLPKRETLDGVEVIRVWSTKLGRAGVFGRMLDYLTYYLSAFLALINVVRKGDVLIAKTDPPMISVAAGLVSKMKGARLVNWCQDLFPEVAGALGMSWANGPLGRSLVWLRNRSLKGAALNVVLNENMKEHLIAEGMPEPNISVLSNWCDARIRPVPEAENELRREWDLEDKTVIAYSGNLGRAHLPPQIAELIQRTRHIEGLAWLFIGGGKGADEVRRAAASEEGGTVLFKPYQPLERLSESLSVADIHLISLAPECEGLIMPSKYYGVLAVDRPVLFLGSPDGAIARDLREHGHGVAIDHEAPESWRAAVEELLASHKDRRGLIDPAWGHAGLGEWRAALKEFG